MRIGSLASHLGVLYDEFDDFLAAGMTSKFRFWYKNLGLNVQTHRYDEITLIVFDEACAPLKWENLSRYQNIGKKASPDWVWRPTFDWVDISSGDKNSLDEIY